jgi:hypothetical protein
MNRLLSLFVIASLVTVGCGTKPDVPPVDVQMRADYLGFLREMNSRQVVMVAYVKDLSSASAELTDNDADKEKLESLCKDLTKTKGKSEEISRICVEMGKLIPMPEKYKGYYPNAKSSGSAAGDENEK